MPAFKSPVPFKNRVCHNCTARTAGCHSTCRSYINEKAEREKKLREYRKDKQYYFLYVEEMKLKGKKR